MTKFRKKPAVIEASDALTPDNAAAVAAWVGADAEVRDDGLLIATLEGAHHASWGDRVIRGVKGEHYPVKPDIFAASYEAAEPTHGMDERLMRLLIRHWRPDLNFSSAAMHDFATDLIADGVTISAPRR